MKVGTDRHVLAPATLAGVEYGVRLPGLESRHRVDITRIFTSSTGIFGAHRPRPRGSCTAGSRRSVGRARGRWPGDPVLDGPGGELRPRREAELRERAGDVAF